MQTRTFVRAIQGNVEVLRIPATEGGYKKLPAGVAVQVTDEEAAFIDNLKGVAIITGRTPRPVKIEKKKEEVKGSGRSDSKPA
jgi:hypothetical protein